MKFTLIILILVLSLAIICLLIYDGNYLYNLALTPKYPKDLIFNNDSKASESIDKSETSGSINESSIAWLLVKSNYQDFYAKSKDKLKLHNFFIENENSSNKWVVIVNGYT